MKRWLGAALAIVAIAGTQLVLRADDRGPRFLHARLGGLQEVPVVSTSGHGEFNMRISRDETSFAYKLVFDDLEGTVSMSHIHVGQPNVNGGITIWLCQGTTAAPASVAGITPACGGPFGGTVEGTITAANVIGPTGQGIPVGEFEEVLKVLRKGLTYVNVHSSVASGGEIRGQIHDRDNDRDHDRDRDRDWDHDRDHDRDR